MSSGRTDSLERVEALLLEVLDAEDWRVALRAVCARAPDVAGRLRARAECLFRMGMIGESGEVRSSMLAARYRIERAIGSGGMGEVLEAWDTELARPVAIKRIRPELLSSPVARSRFEREVVSASKLAHPGVCRIYSAETDETGAPFAVMELVAGEPLEQALRNSASGLGQMPRVVELLARLAEALHAVHETGFVHRDLKPSNVMVTPDGRPVLLDFGLARALDGSDASYAALTRTAESVGTPAYMAPEQIDPGMGPVDRAADLHAFGVLAYECLTGRSPFHGEGRDEIYRLVLHSEPLDPRRLRPAVSKDLAAVVLKCLEKRPERRLSTGRELAEELERVRSGAPTRTRPIGRFGRAGRHIRRHPLVSALAASVVLSVAIGWLLTVGALRESDANLAVARARVLVRTDPPLASLLSARAIDGGAGADARSAFYEAAANLRLRRRLPIERTPIGIAASSGFDAVGVMLWQTDLEPPFLLRPDGTRVFLGAKRAGRTRTLAIDTERDRVLLVGVQMSRSGPLGSTVQMLTLDGEPVFDAERQGLLLRGGLHAGQAFLAFRDGAAELLDLDGVQLQSFRFPSPSGARWVDVAWSVEAGMTAWGASDGSVWIRQAGGESRRIPLFDGPARRLRFSPDGAMLLAVHCGAEPFWEDVEPAGLAATPVAAVLRLDDSSVRRLEGHRDEIHDARWSPQGQRVLTVSRDRTARLWTVSTEAEEPPSPVVCWHDGQVESGAFGADGQLILTTESHGSAVVWDLLGRRVSKLVSSGAGTRCGALPAPGETVWTGSRDRELLQWDVRSRWMHSTWTSGQCVGAAWMPSGLLWTATRQGVVECWEPGRSDRLSTSSCELLAGESVSSLAGFAGVVLLATSQGRILEFDTDAESWRVVYALPTRRASFRGLAVCDRWIATSLVGSMPSRVLVLDRATSQPRPPFWRPGQPSPNGRLRWSSDGGRLSFGAGHGIGLLDLTAEPSWYASPPVGEKSHVTASAWSPVAKQLFAVTVRGEVIRWREGEALTRLLELPVGARDLTVHPNGELLAVAGADRRVYLIDTSGEQRLELPALGAAIRQLAFDSSGERLAVVTLEGELTVWPIDLASSGVELLASLPYSVAIEDARRRENEKSSRTAPR